MYVGIETNDDNDNGSSKDVGSICDDKNRGNINYIADVDVTVVMLVRVTTLVAVLTTMMTKMINTIIQSRTRK